ncbi:motilin receptor [Bombina bombina]|uniref:motilin receptor n=1 Tax=Bombina bombina TaxID=8345 RepID=UPI00235A867D|nr:motilin receptor [Bombina bombina]
MKNRSSSEIRWGDYNYDLPECGENICSYFTVATLIPVTAVSLVLMIVGLLGNAITILIIRRYKEMKTTTNFYLSSMALSDLVILLCMPFDLYRLWRSTPWIFGSFLCKFHTYIGEGCTYSTILHITALSIERYLAICFPLQAKVFITKARVKFVIILLWAIALLSAGPFYVLSEVHQPYNNTNYSKTLLECRYTSYALESGLLNVMYWVTTVYFVIPMFCLSFLYGFIGRKLWKNKDKVRGPNTANREKCHKQTVRILVLVVLAFIICWLPFHTGRIIFVNSDIKMVKVSQYFNVVAMLLFYLSASINPILYNLISKKYRTAAYKLLRQRPDEKACNIIKENTGGATEISAFIQNESITLN